MLKLIKNLTKKEWLLIIVIVALVLLQVWLDLKMPDYMSEITKLVQTEGSKMSDILINGVMGLCGESGEVIDLVKKHLAQGHELDKERLAKELGDVAWYLAETAYAIGYDLEDIFQMNLDKLEKGIQKALTLKNQ